MPPRYKPIEECRPLLQRYAKHLKRTADDNDPEKRNTGSADKYIRSLRWFDRWLDQLDYESPLDVDNGDVYELGHTLSSDFNGSTGMYRWNEIHSFYEFLQKMELADNNPLDRWHDDKGDEFGLTRSSEQSKHLKEGESYAVSQEDVRLMEENVGRPRLRNQLLLRMLWQTGMRRGEISGLTLSDLDRDNREITVRAENAKNNKRRVVGYQPSLDGLLTTWIEGGKRDGYNVHGRDWLFLGERGAQLSGEAINEVVRKAAINAGINRKLDYEDANSGSRWLITSHNIRHGYGSFLVNEIMPENDSLTIYDVSKQMGHSSIDVTEEIYIEHNPEAGLEKIKQFGPE